MKKLTVILTEILQEVLQWKDVTDKKKFASVKISKQLYYVEMLETGQPTGKIYQTVWHKNQDTYEEVEISDAAAKKKILSAAKKEWLEYNTTLDYSVYTPNNYRESLNDLEIGDYVLYQSHNQAKATAIVKKINGNTITGIRSFIDSVGDVKFDKSDILQAIPKNK